MALENYSKTAAKYCTVAVEGSIRATIFPIQLRAPALLD